MTATGRKKLDELYHPMCERSEFYSMSDLTKPPVLFSPAEDIDKVSNASDNSGVVIVSRNLQVYLSLLLYLSAKYCFSPTSVPFDFWYKLLVYIKILWFSFIRKFSRH